jgi:adenylate cyclase
MLTVEEELIDAITETMHYLRTGRVPPPIAIPDDLPDNEIRQLITFVNRFLVDFVPFAEAMEQLAQGELDTRSVMGRMSVIHSLKALQSNLRHLTWKTQQIASGDLEQRVDFMGDFSAAFNSMTQQLKNAYEDLERRNEFIRKTFGRYTSDDIVEAILDVPDGLELGGEKREITIMMSDLRGFTALSERLEPTEVVALLNYYFSAMFESIQRYQGTIDEIIGDAILVLFGAPVAMEDASLGAVCCALEMQKAMGEVNAHNAQMGWPEIEMGIALHTGEVVVGNIGSTKRSKYGVVGRPINLTARIESYTVGGQILLSPTLLDAVQGDLILGDEIEIHAKGMSEPLQCRELLGHEDYPELMIEEDETSCVSLVQAVPCYYVRLTEKHLEEKNQSATLVGLSQRRAVIEAAGPLARYSNIMLQFEDKTGGEEVAELYAKVLRPVHESPNRYLIHFTSIPPGMKAWLSQLASVGNSESTQQAHDL